MNLLSDWKWYAALAVFVLFTAFVVWLPGPGTKTTSAPVPSAAKEPPVANADAPSSAAQESAPDCSGMFQYTVQEGDTVAEIARLFTVSTDEIRRINHIPFRDEPAPGRNLCIPMQDAPPSTHEGPAPMYYEDMLQYTVQDDDTVAGIARLFVVSEDDLRRVNHITDGDEPPFGRMIWIPPAQ